MTSATQTFQDNLQKTKQDTQKLLLHQHHLNRPDTPKMQYNTLIAIMAALSSASASAVLPRATTSRFWSVQRLPVASSDFFPNGSVFVAENGKFYLGNTVGPQKTVVIACADDTGVPTTCALVSSHNLSPLQLFSNLPLWSIILTPISDCQARPSACLHRRRW